MIPFSSSNALSIALLCAFLPTTIPSVSPPNFIKSPSHSHALLHSPTAEAAAALTWDPLFNHFLASSHPHHHPPSIISISTTGVTHLLFTDPSLPPNSTFLSLSLDPLHRRLLALLRSAPLSSPLLLFLSSYDLLTHRRLFLTQLSSSSPLSAHLAVDIHGSAYVTDSVENVIWKVTAEGLPTVFSRSPLFTDFPVITDGVSQQTGGSGLSGIGYVSRGYLLVVQWGAGKMFKVKEEDGTARVVELSGDLVAAEGVVVRRDGVVVVMGGYRRRVLYLRSYDSWGTGLVYDGKVIGKRGRKRVPLGVATGEGDRVYVLYGGGGGGSEEEEERSAWFDIEEVGESGEEDEHVWIFILLGFGLVYFWFWRFQMGRLFFNLNKKIQ